MVVHAYLSVDTDNSTALNSTDFGFDSNALAFEDNKGALKVSVPAGASTEPLIFMQKMIAGMSPSKLQFLISVLMQLMSSLLGLLIFQMQLQLLVKINDNY